MHTTISSLDIDARRRHTVCVHSAAEEERVFVVKCWVLISSVCVLVFGAFLDAFSTLVTVLLFCCINDHVGDCSGRSHVD